MAARGKTTSRTAAAPTASSGRAPFAATLAPRELFLYRVRRGVVYALTLVGGTLAAGMIGYRLLEQMSWLDAFHQAAMLLSGMGPVVEVKSTAGKLFDGIYALFCGVILLASTGLLFAPVLHRILHRFHLEDARER